MSICAVSLKGSEAGVAISFGGFHMLADVAVLFMMHRYFVSIGWIENCVSESERS